MATSGFWTWYIYAEFIKQNTGVAEDERLTWLAPLNEDEDMCGNERGPASRLMGTIAFPSFRLYEDDLPKLPLQTDSYNCGFGVITAKATIMMDAVAVEGSEYYFLWEMMQTDECRNKPGNVLPFFCIEWFSL